MWLWALETASKWIWSWVFWGEVGAVLGIFIYRILQKWKIICITLFLLVYKHLKIRIVLFLLPLNELSYPQMPQTTTWHIFKSVRFGLGVSQTSYTMSHLRKYYSTIIMTLKYSQPSSVRGSSHRKQDYVIVKRLLLNPEQNWFRANLVEKVLLIHTSLPHISSLEPRLQWFWTIHFTSTF